MKLPDKTKYKAIVSDFDGTLIGADLSVSERTRKAITAVIKSGYIFTIATGRAFVGPIEQATKQLHLLTPLVIRGGAEIIDPKTKKILTAEYMSDQTVEQIISLFEEKNINYLVEKGMDIYSNDGKPHWQLDNIPMKKLQDVIIKNIPKMVVYEIDAEEKLKLIDRELSHLFPNIHITRSFSPVGKSWDITAAQATKQIALQKLAKLLNIEPHEIIGIGDGYNDFPLLEACGYKVAMGNAIEDIKQIADTVIPSYQEDGVAKFLEQLLRHKI